MLVLNQNYEPLGICTLEKAIILLWLGKAEMVEAKPNRAIHTARAAWPWPSVVRLSSYIRLPYKKVELSRRNILRRDGHRCAYCGRSTPPLTVDHVIPRSRNGGDVWENLVAACVRCNNKKGNRTPEEAGMPLRLKPFRPNYVTFLRTTVGTVAQEWEPYLFMR